MHRYVSDRHRTSEKSKTSLTDGQDYAQRLARGLWTRLGRGRQPVAIDMSLAETPGLSYQKKSGCRHGFSKLLSRTESGLCALFTETHFMQTQSTRLSVTVGAARLSFVSRQRINIHVQSTYHLTVFHGHSRIRWS